MIRAEVADTYKEILGVQYAQTIADYLKQEGILNRKGTHYSVWSVYQFMTGKRENEIVEKAITDLIEETLKKQKAKMNREDAIVTKGKKRLQALLK